MAVIGHIAKFPMTVGLMVDAEAGRMGYVFNQPIFYVFSHVVLSTIRLVFAYMYSLVTTSEQ